MTQVRKRFLPLIVLVATITVWTAPAASQTAPFSDSGQRLGGNHAGQDVAFGDLDGDGDLDAFVVNTNGQPNRVFFNDGAAHFVDSGQTLGSADSHGVALGDLDGDGDLDAFVANTGANRIMVNDGLGVFTATAQQLGNADSRAVALGDFDGDGDLDAFVANVGSNTYYTNLGGLVFSASGQTIGNAQSFGVAVGDINHDTFLDVFVANYQDQNNDPAPNYVWFGNGAGSFTQSLPVGGTFRSTSVALGNINQDGWLDAFVTNDVLDPDTVWINQQVGMPSGGGHFALLQELGATFSQDVALGDLNGDGFLDAFVAVDDLSNNSASQANRVYLYDPMAVPSAPFVLDGQLIGMGNSKAAALANLDGVGEPALEVYVAQFGEGDQVWHRKSAPVAMDDGYMVDEDTTLAVLAAAGVMFNDVDPENFTLTAMVTAGPGVGVLAFNGTTGAFTYTAPANRNNDNAMPITFRYTVSDGTQTSNEATVTINITPVNDPPIAVADAYTTSEDTPTFVESGLLSNDTDIDITLGEMQVLTVVNAGPGQPTSQGGQIDVLPSGEFMYVPAPNFFGTDTFVYTVTDGFATAMATATFTVTPVNDAPVAVNDTATTNEDVAVEIDVPANDMDVESDSLLVTEVGPVAPVGAGSVAITGAGTTVTFTPAANRNVELDGPATFTYTISDGHGGSDTAMVTVTVNAVNDGPPVAVGNSYSTDEDTTLTVGAPGVLGNDTDPDLEDTLTAQLVLPPTRGTLTLNADGSFTYVPTPDNNGGVFFSYRVFDGGLLSNTVNVTILISAINDAPMAADDSYSTEEDTALTVGAPGVLGNDTDIDSMNLTVAVLASVSHGSLTLNANGSFTYTPTPNYTGPDSFTYTVSDGSGGEDTGLVSISVGPVNDPPVANNES